MDNFTVACVQLNSNDDYQQSTKDAVELIRQAANAGAELIITPENTAHMADLAKFNDYHYYEQDTHPSLQSFIQLAKDLGVYLLIGSLIIKLQDKLANRSFFISPQGQIINHYDKIHLFDAKLTSGERYAESRRFVAGENAVIASTPWGIMGMTICYDLRFPYLFRHLALQGASFIAVPSAFTEITGAAHWHVLLRARAIENSCYIFAPNQCGTHAGSRKTYGHSLIINPWGEILAEASNQPGIIIANIDLQFLHQVRNNMPSLKHNRNIANL
jgi:predicted amidohydrolase